MYKKLEISVLYIQLESSKYFFLILSATYAYTITYFIIRKLLISQVIHRRPLEDTEILGCRVQFGKIVTRYPVVKEKGYVTSDVILDSGNGVTGKALMTLNKNLLCSLLEPIICYKGFLDELGGREEIRYAVHPKCIPLFNHGNYIEYFLGCDFDTMSINIKNVRWVFIMIISISLP